MCLPRILCVALMAMLFACLGVNGLEAYGVIGPDTLLARVARGVYLLGCPAAGLVLLAFYTVRYIGLRRRLRRNGYRLCPRCEYPLTGLPERHVCPECGRQYEKASVERQWKRWVHRTGFRVR